MMKRLLLGLSVAAAVPCLLTLMPLLYLAPNRLLSGMPIFADAALGIRVWPVAALSVVGLGCLALGRSRVGGIVAATACAAALILLLAGLGAGASTLLSGQSPAARVRLAAGAWIGIVVLSAGCVKASERMDRRSGGWAMAAGLIVLGALFGSTGRLDAFSIVMEMRARHDILVEAVFAHLVLAGAALVIAAMVAGLLGLLRGAQAIVDLALGGIQIVPAVALFGALVALASALLGLWPALRGYGLSALGTGPALIGIAAYLLLPLWRGLQAALRAPDPASLDAARAIGLNPRQILLQLRLPLGAPQLIGGLRVAAVQALGLATLGALIGAGGLGTLVFDGMSQFAPDLILLGAVPIVGLSLVTEAGLSRLEATARRRWPS